MRPTPSRIGRWKTTSSASRRTMAIVFFPNLRPRAPSLPSSSTRALLYFPEEKEQIGRWKLRNFSDALSSRVAQTMPVRLGPRDLTFADDVTLICVIPRPRERSLTPFGMTARLQLAVARNQLSRHAFATRMNPDKLFDYLDGKLSAQERAALEEKLTTDPLLQRELAIAREI